MERVDNFMTNLVQKFRRMSTTLPSLHEKYLRETHFDNSINNFQNLSFFLFITL